MDFSLKMGFSLFFPCYVWGGRAPTAALAERTRDESRQTFRLGDYPIRQAIAHTEQAVFNGFYQIACISCLSAHTAGVLQNAPTRFN